MAVARKENYPLFGVRAFVLVQHYFRYSKFKHSREGFDRFFLRLFLSDLVALSAFSGTDFTSFEAFSDTFQIITAARFVLLFH